MQMTEQEITSKYRRANNKGQQAQILAELNGVSKDDIIEILKKNGVADKELPRARKKKVAQVQQVEQSSSVKVEAVRKNNQTEENEVTAETLFKEEDETVKEEKNMAAVPESVKKALTDRIIAYTEAIDEQIKELEELKEYLKKIS